MSGSSASSSNSPNDDRKPDEVEVARAYNDIIIGIHILYEAADSGNRIALQRLKLLANQAILFAGQDRDEDTQKGHEA